MMSLSALQRPVYANQRTTTERRQASNFLSACPSRLQPARPFGLGRQTQRGGALVSRAATDPQETGLDRYLRAAADKFENAQNKPAVAGWAVGAVFALFFAEWLIHKPVLSILLGFPIQLLGLLVLPNFAVKYLVEKKSAGEDARSAVNSLAKQLPGLEKESF